MRLFGAIEQLEKRSPLLDYIQALSNSAASTVSGPVDLIAMGLRAAGVPVPQDAVLSSEWMARRGLTKEVPQGAARVLGETTGLVAPVAIAAKAPQVAAALNQAGMNMRAPATIAGPSARQRGMIPVIFKKGGIWSDIDVLDNGLAVVKRPGYGFENLSDLRQNIFLKAQDKFGNKYDHFFRFTNNPQEIALAKSGKIRPSFNHLDGFQENGLSVANGPHYGIAGYKYGYPVRGNVIGYGSDGEPLLDVATVEPLTKRVASAKDVIAQDKQLLANRLKQLGLPEDYFVGGSQKWLNNPNTFEPVDSLRSEYEKALMLIERNGAPLR